MRNPNFSYGIRILAGVYLIYTAFTLGKAYFNGETGIGMFLSGILFGLFAVGFIVTGMKGISSAKKAAEEEPKEEASAPEPEPVPARKSIGERARMTANLDEEPAEALEEAEERAEDDEK